MDSNYTSWLRHCNYQFRTTILRRDLKVDPTWCNCEQAASQKTWEPTVTTNHPRRWGFLLTQYTSYITVKNTLCKKVTYGRLGDQVLSSPWKREIGEAFGGVLRCAILTAPNERVKSYQRTLCKFRMKHWTKQCKSQLPMRVEQTLHLWFVFFSRGEGGPLLSSRF